MLKRFAARFMGKGTPGIIAGSIADGLLQRDVLNAITSSLRTEDDSTWQIRATVQGQPPMSADGSRVIGPWSERWLFTSGAVAWDFTVDFTLTADGGTDYHIDGTAVEPAGRDTD